VRAVVQRVLEASVSVDGEVVGAIAGPGLCVFVGVTHSDTPATAAAMATKLAGLRILRDERSVEDAGAPVLVVSQFTLYAETSKGRRPSWSAASPGTHAEPLVAAVARALSARGIDVATGRFGADMRVHLVNDGPVTLLLELP
jgi:D-tyrosyl-tRNA(Tyr) deacylase